MPVNVSMKQQNRVMIGNLSTMEDSLLYVWLTEDTFVMWNMSVALQLGEKGARSKNKWSTFASE